MPSDNGWNEWSKYVLKELERLNDAVEKFPVTCSEKHGEIIKELEKIKIELAMLKVKAGVWGMMGGAIPVAIGFAIWFLQQ